MNKRLSRLFASGFSIGFLPGAPGTYASLATAIAFFAVVHITHRLHTELHVSAVCLITLVGTLAAARTARDSGIEDPSFVVIDEVAGQLTTFLFLPASGINIILGFAAFRVFDIWKPFPIRRLERLGNGVGIMADDLLAGVYGNLVLQILNYIYRAFY